MKYLKHGFKLLSKCQQLINICTFPGFLSGLLCFSWYNDCMYIQYSACLSFLVPRHKLLYWSSLGLCTWWFWGFYSCVLSFCCFWSSRICSMQRNTKYMLSPSSIYAWLHDFFLQPFLSQLIIYSISIWSASVGSPRSKKSFMNRNMVMEAAAIPNIKAIFVSDIISLCQ